MNIPNKTPQIYKSLSKSQYIVNEKTENKLKFWRVFVSGPVANDVLGGSEFIFMGEDKDFIEKIQNNYENVKISTKPIPMFGTFSTTTIQVLPVQQKDEKTFEYYFMMPEGGWDDVLAIKYVFETEEKMPSSCCLIKCKSVKKDQISKTDLYLDRLEKIKEVMERESEHIRSYLPSKKIVNEWVSSPTVPVNMLSDMLQKLSNNNEQPIPIFQSIVNQKMEDGIPESIVKIAKELHNVVMKSNEVMKQIKEKKN